MFPKRMKNILNEFKDTIAGCSRMIVKFLHCSRSLTTEIITLKHFSICALLPNALGTSVISIQELYFHVIYCFEVSNHFKLFSFLILKIPSLGFICKF